MVKAEWGIKRLCTSCGARFYDMRRDPIVCPSCGAVYNPEFVAKPRRARPAAAAAVAKGAAALAVDDEVSVGEDAGVDVEGLEEEEGEPEGDDAVEETEEDEETEDNDAMIEDASELGEDDEMTDIDTGLEDEDER